MNVRTLCLGILYFGDATGYEIRKLAQEGRFSHFIEASFGAIYPALARLHNENKVSLREEAQTGKPSRKVYTITDAGRQELVATLGQGSAPDVFKSEFLFTCLYAGLLDRAALAGLMDAQLAHIDAGLQRLDEAGNCCDLPCSRFVIGYGKALHKAAADYVRANRAQIENLARDAAPVAAE